MPACRPTGPTTGPTTCEAVGHRDRAVPSAEQQLERQERLQEERQLDAADMGAAEADPAELIRYRAKQKQTHNRNVQKRRALTRRGRRGDTTLKPGTPTRTDDANVS